MKEKRNDIYIECKEEIDKNVVLCSRSRGMKNPTNEMGDKCLIFRD